MKDISEIIDALPPKIKEKAAELSKRMPDGVHILSAEGQEIMYRVMSRGLEGRLRHIKHRS